MVGASRGDPDAAHAYAQVAELLRDYGDPFEEAMALTGGSRLAAADDPSPRARELLERLGVAD